MKFLTAKRIIHLSLSMTAIYLIALAALAQASPTVQLFGGVTQVQLSSDFTAALGSLSITPAAVEPGAISESMVRFPTSGGGLDQATLRGDIFHSGGLSLTNQAGTSVQLFNFIIDTSGEQAVLTGLVTANDDLVNRIPLFNLDLADAEIETNPFSLVVTSFFSTVN